MNLEFVNHRRKEYCMKNLKNGLSFGLSCLVLIWVVMIISFFFPLSQYGIIPREISLRAFIGLFFYPFIHGDLGHILANSLPLFVLTTALAANYPKLTTRIMFLSALITGVLLWLFGRSGAVHIGASGLILSLIGFLVFNAPFRRDWKSLLIAVIIGFFYWTAIFGIFPSSDSRVSWEGHLFGFLVGILLAYIFRKRPGNWT